MCKAFTSLTGPAMTLRIVEFFDSAHSLPDEEWLTTKKCCQMHGHTYKAEVRLAGAWTKDVVIDFGSVKKILRELDHRNLNEVFEAEPGFGNLPTTAENIVIYIAGKITAVLPEGVQIECIRLWEGWKGDDSSAVEYEP